MEIGTLQSDTTWNKNATFPSKESGKKYYPSGKWRQRRQQQTLNASKNSWHNARCAAHRMEMWMTPEWYLWYMCARCAHVLLADFYFLSLNWFVHRLCQLPCPLLYRSCMQTEATSESASRRLWDSLRAECMWLFQNENTEKCFQFGRNFSATNAFACDLSISDVQFWVFYAGSASFVDPFWIIDAFHVNVSDWILWANWCTYALCHDSTANNAHSWGFYAFTDVTNANRMHMWERN